MCKLSCSYGKVSHTLKKKFNSKYLKLENSLGFKIRNLLKLEFDILNFGNKIISNLKV